MTLFCEVAPKNASQQTCLQVGDMVSCKQTAKIAIFYYSWKKKELPNKVTQRIPSSSDLQWGLGTKIGSETNIPASFQVRISFEFTSTLWIWKKITPSMSLAHYYIQGRHSNQSHVLWPLFFAPPESQYIFWAPRNKNFQIPEVALVDFTPDWHQWLY